MMGVPTLTKIRKTDIMSKRKYSIHKAPGSRRLKEFLLTHPLYKSP